MTCANGAQLDSDPLYIDTDLDGLNDSYECLDRGLDPRVPDDNELGIDGLPPRTLFQPLDYGFTSVINEGWLPVPPWGRIVYSDQPVVYDDNGDCILNTNCGPILATAEEALTSSLCFRAFVTVVLCDSTEEIARELISDAVEKQQVFTEDGLITGSYVGRQAFVLCLAGAELADCDYSASTNSPAFDPFSLQEVAEDESVRQLIEEAAIDVVAEIVGIPSKWNPDRDTLCGTGPRGGRGGVYTRLDPITQEPVYVGRTNNFRRRNNEHDRSDLLGDTVEGETLTSDDRLVQRALEQHQFNQLWGDRSIAEVRAEFSEVRNRRRPVAQAKWDSFYESIVERYFDECVNVE